MKIKVTDPNVYKSQYVSDGDVVEVEGFTIHGHPYITSKHKNNHGHKVVFMLGQDCEVVH